MGCVFKDASCSVSCICFRVEILLEPEPTRHTGADNHTANELSYPCGLLLGMGSLEGRKWKK
jgi:hypothetical protein